MSKSCISHHFACDCREAEFAALKSRVAEMEVEHAIWEKASLVRLVKDNQKLEAQLAKAREGLSKIEKLQNDTLYGNASDYDFDAEDAYSGGSMDAFNTASDMAREALTELDGMEKGEKPQPVVYGTEGESGV